MKRDMDLIREILSEKARSLSFEILKSILMDLMKGAISGG